MSDDPGPEGRGLYERILGFIGDPDRGGSDAEFHTLALEAFRYQFEHITPYRRLCRRRGALPGALRSWKEIPPVPAVAFKSLELAAAPGGEVFRSSGTTAGNERRSVHRNPFPQLYRAAIDASFPRACLPAEPPVPMLSLIPPLAAAPDSSLSFMVDHLYGRWGAPGSVQALGAHGLDEDAAWRWVGERRGGPPALVLSTALALLQWLEHLEDLGRQASLPAGSVLFETGGFKGRRRETSRGALIPRVQERLGIPRNRIVREYGMTELSSQFYTEVLTGGEEDLFLSPPWTRVRILDPKNLEELPAGEVGLVAVLDLANLGSALHVLTEDLGRRDGEGFRLLGRASGAELRGCSLTAEELG